MNLNFLSTQIPITQTSFLLTRKLNKYLINIIDQYNTINIYDLTKEIPKFRYNSIFRLDKNFTTDDVLIKSIHRGYKGFYINKYYEVLIRDIDKTLNENINKTTRDIDIFYYYGNDYRNYSMYIDILKIDNVVYKINTKDIVKTKL